LATERAQITGIVRESEMLGLALTHANHANSAIN
jgi:hypothetical protein